MSPIDRDHQSLEDFLSCLRDPRISWKSSHAKSPRPTVPACICFDQTQPIFGISRPTWRKERQSPTPWTEYFLHTRDVRVLQASTQADYLAAHIERRRAQKLYLRGRVHQPSVNDWERIQTIFLRCYSGPLQNYLYHVWQAIDCRFQGKDQCFCCRTYYNAHTVCANRRDGKTNTESDFPLTTTFALEGRISLNVETKQEEKRLGQERKEPRQLGRCSESCLHAEFELSNVYGARRAVGILEIGGRRLSYPSLTCWTQISSIFTAAARLRRTLLYNDMPHVEPRGSADVLQFNAFNLCFLAFAI